MGGAKLKAEDKVEVDTFIENQSQTYTCGSDFSELASSVKVSKACLQPYCQTYFGFLTLSCLHPVDEKVYKLDQHKRTCSQCGDNSLNPIVANQFPLCTMSHEMEWPFKLFPVIAKRVYAKKARTGNEVQVAVEEVVEEGNSSNDDEINYDDDNEHNNDEVAEVEGEFDDVDSIDHNSTGIIAETDLVIGSKKRNQRSMKTSQGNLVCDSDINFLRMHGAGEFSSLPCNAFSNNELLRRHENKAHNNKSAK